MNSSGRSAPAIPAFRPVAGVYALADPRTGRVMYVGQSIDVDYRYRQHLDADAFGGNAAVARWVLELRALGLRPALSVLVECEWPGSDEAEREAIAAGRSRGECELNTSPGGLTVRSSRLADRSHPDEWFQLGIKVKRARALLLDIAADVGRLLGVRASQGAAKPVRAIDRLKSTLDDAMSRTFPGHEGLARVFYGPETDD